MKTNSRFLLVLSTTFLFAALVVDLSGCANSEPSGHGLAGPKTVVAVVTYKDGDPSAHMTVTPPSPLDPKMIRLSEGDGDTAWWLSPSGTIHLKWKGRKPFDKDPAYADGVLKSGRPSKGSSHVTSEGKCKDSKHECYEYEMELWLDTAGGKKVPIDPRIEVMP